MSANAIQSAIESSKTKLFQESMESAPNLTQCYDNWFESNISNTAIPETAKVWESAREMFFALTLSNVTVISQLVADEIQRQFSKAHPVAAADVSDNLRNTPLMQILQYEI